MKVKELMEHLSQADPEALVVLSRDSEGNSYQEVWAIETNMTFIERDAEAYYRELTPEMIEEGWVEDDIRPNGPLAVVLWPGG